MNRTLGIRFSPEHLALASIVAALIVAVGVGFGSDPLATGIAAGIAALLVLVTFRGSTLVDWVRLRRHTRGKIVPATSHTRDKAGVVWDGQNATVWMEVTPEEPYLVTSVSHSGVIDREPLPVEKITSLLRQFDIVLSRVDVISHGVRTALSGHRPSLATLVVAGATPWTLHGRTYLSVVLDLTASLAAVDARAKKGNIPLGLDRTVLVAASRIRLACQQAGVRARLLNRAQVEQLTAEIVSQAGPALDDQHWTGSGSDRTVQVNSLTTAGPGWDEKAHREWMTTPAHRTIEVLSLSETGHEPRASYIVTFVQRGSSLVSLSRLRSFGLRPLGGQQRQAATRFIPLATEEEVTVPLHDPFEKGSPVMYPGGLGVYTGTSRELGQVFLRIDTGRAQPLWLIGPDVLAEQYVLRLSAALMTVDVRITGEKAEQWERFISRLGTPLITFNARETADVVVVGPEQASDYRGRNQTVIVTSPTVPAITPRYSVVATGDHLVATMGTRRIEVPWTIPNVEAEFLSPELLS